MTPLVLGNLHAWSLIFNLDGSYSVFVAYLVPDECKKAITFSSFLFDQLIN